MFADTAAIGAAGAGLSRAAAEFDVIAAALPAAAEPCATALGPVGADFLTALATALGEAAREVTRLSADLSEAAVTAAATAASYADAEQRADRSIAMLGS
jgi:hypothetical protein